ncbi:MAG: T9SS type A sorting domain-containing protein [Ignavibacteriaceae bacterium]
MKKLFLTILVVFVICINFINAQTFQDDTYYKRLYYTCKVWGFLKYFHSEVAKVTKNWDLVLFQTLDNVKNDASNYDFNKTLESIINSAGKMAQPSTQLPDVPDSLKYNLNLNWLSDPVFSNEIRARLDTVRDWFRPQNNFYVQSNSLGLTFNTDKAYYSNTNAFASENYRLLTLFRYWNIINYFFPDKYLMDKNWDSTLVEFIPKIDNASDSLSFFLTFLELSTRLNDSHAITNSEVWCSLFGCYYLPLTLKYVEKETVVARVLEKKLEIKPGDIIKSINNLDIQTIRDSLRRYTPGSNDAAINRNINDYFLVRGQKGQVNMTIENESGQKDIVLQCNMTYTEYINLYTKHSPVWKKIFKGSKVYGYVDMERLEISGVDSMFNNLWNTDAIIFDIRNYPNGTLWYLLNYLFRDDIHIADFTIPDVKYPGTLYWSYSNIGSVNPSELYRKNIFILMDENTQSQAEYTVMGLEQYPKAIKIGSQTAGADGNWCLIYLPGGITTHFTGMGTFYPDHRQTQRIGIIPDIFVYPTIEGIREGKDEVLEAALNYSPDGVQNNSLNKNLKFSLYQNYPNPFNPITVIEFTVAKRQLVSIKVYDLLGREIATLVNEEKPGGNYKVEFDGSKFTSGIYFYRMQAGTFFETKKLILLK